MEILFDEQITDRKEFCLRKHIALWDVIESCTIHGSSDSSIRDVKANDIEWLIRNSSVHAVFTTGAKAASLYRKHVSASLDAKALPSTSAANAHMRLNDLVKEYDCVRKALEP
jgi:hypoxanthine-DNA glycosylase